MGVALKESSSAVREDRLWQRHADMAKLGGTAKGGVNRQALSPEDAATRSAISSCAATAPTPMPRR
jgi:N-carbamoyl-L-amino-acid hydrolase